MSGLQATLTPCHPEHTFSLAQRKSMQKESETGWLAKQLCHPEFISGSNHRNIIPLPKNINNIPSTSCTAKRHVKGDYVPQKESKTGGLSKQLRILCRVRTESETRSNANKSECERSVMNDLFAWHTFSLAERKSMQKESETGWLSKQLCHPELVSGSSPRKIIPSPENINNIPFAFHAAKRKVRGDYVPRKAAFTLAEVLITLGIIGVVAALTLPTLIQNQQEKEKVVRLKKAYSILNNAIQRAITEDGPISSWSGISKSESATSDMTDEEKEEISQASVNTSKAFMAHIKPYLNFIRYCVEKECRISYERYSLDGTRFSSMSEKSILSDGTGIVDLWIYDPLCKENLGNTKALQHVCGEMFVDIKANQKKTKITGDTVFLFYITEYGLYPMGSAMEYENKSKRPPYPFSKYCNISRKHSSNGYGCTAWVLENENMDYKKCSDLSWSGKRKCK